MSNRGLRGSTLEDALNFTNEMYRRGGLAIVQKVPTPITPVEFSRETSTINLAYFERKSTVDYIGAVQGIPICFDAKETALKNLPIANIAHHQIEFMQDWQKQGGIAFMIVHFSRMGEYYFLPLAILIDFWQSAQRGGRKSIPYDAFEKKYQLENKGGAHIHYLEAINVYLEGAN